MRQNANCRIRLSSSSGNRIDDTVVIEKKERKREGENSTKRQWKDRKKSNNLWKKEILEEKIATQVKNVKVKGMEK